MKKTITVDVNEIVYDIRNKTYLTGKSRADGTNHRQVAQMMANEDDENAAQVLRSIHSALGEIRTKMAEYHEVSPESVTNIYDESTDTVQLVCDFPGNFNTAALDGMAMAIHRYIVARAVAEWFTITHKSDAADYERMAQESLANLAESVSKRSRPTRKVTPSE